MPASRNYQAEYRRRIERGLSKGLTRSQSRGHPRYSEKTSSRAASPPPPDAALNAALLLMNHGAALSSAAREAHVSPERLRRYLKVSGVAKREGRAWVMTDNRVRRVSIIKASSARAIYVPGFAEASKVGRYHNAVGRFANSADPDELSEFEGDGVTDINGRFHPFETEPNDLFRYVTKDEPQFHEIYQIVAN